VGGQFDFTKKKTATPLPIIMSNTNYPWQNDARAVCSNVLQRYHAVTIPHNTIIWATLHRKSMKTHMYFILFLSKERFKWLPYFTP
jgi:hypothetical protein